MPLLINLVVIQILNCLIFRFAGKSFFTEGMTISFVNVPPILRDHRIAKAVVITPNIIFIGEVIAAFIYTNSPWLFSIFAIGTMIWAAPPYRSNPPASALTHRLKLEAIELADAKNFSLAVSKLNEAKCISPDDPAIFNNLGACYIRLSQYQDAIDALHKCIKLKPDHTGAMLNLGVAYEFVGSPQEAIEIYKKALIIKSGNSIIKGRLAALEERHGERGIEPIEQGGQESGKNNAESLHFAAMASDYDIERMLLKQTDINVRNDEGLTPLHCAAFAGAAGNAEKLIRYGANVNSRCIAEKKYWDGITPIHAASFHACKDILALLIANNADIAARDQTGNNALHWACTLNQQIAELLIAMGADVNASNQEGTTPLHLAARNFSESSVLEAILSNNNVGIHLPDNHGLTPLHMAVLGRCSNSVELLLSEGADIHCVDDQGQTPLHKAALSGDINSIDILLSKGVRINVQDQKGRTPLHLAGMRNQENAVQHLLSLGADTTTLDLKGALPQTTGFIRINRDYWNNCRFDEETLDTVRLLIRHGVNINERNTYGDTPLHIACGIDLSDVEKYFDAFFWKGEHFYSS